MIELHNMDTVSNNELIAINTILNLPGFNTVAASSFKANIESSYPKSMPKWNEYPVLSISGCNSSVNIDLDIYNEAEFNNTLQKLNKLKSVISFAEETITYIYEYNERLKEAKEELSKAEKEAKRHGKALTNLEYKELTKELTIKYNLIYNES